MYSPSLPQCTHQVCHNIITKSVKMYSQSLPQCTHQVCHNVLTKSATIYSPSLPQCTHQVCHNVLTKSATIWSPSLPQCIHQVCHNILTKSATMYSPSLPIHGSLSTAVYSVQNAPLPVFRTALPPSYLTHSLCSHLTETVTTGVKLLLLSIPSYQCLMNTS